MRFVQFESIQSGMVLARPVYSDSKGILAGRGIAINENVLKHLESMGVQGVYIEDSRFDDVTLEDVIKEEYRIKAYDALKAGDFNMCVSLVKAMAAEMKSHTRNDIELIDIRSFKNYEYAHSVSVAVYCIAMGLKMSMNEEQLNNLAIAAILHDIGKFDISSRVLNSKQIYKNRQMDEMMKHPMYSYEDLKAYPNVSAVARNTILHHHENLDGSGYYGITADKIGLHSRILRVVDTYDALTSTKRYRAAFTPAAAFRCIADDAGKIYDIEVARTFFSIAPMFPLGYTVKLDNGKAAVVIGHSADMERPVVRTFDNEVIDLSEKSNGYISVSDDIVK